MLLPCGHDRRRSCPAIRVNSKFNSVGKSVVRSQEKHHFAVAKLEMTLRINSALEYKYQ